MSITKRSQSSTELIIILAILLIIFIGIMNLNQKYISNFEDSFSNTNLRNTLREIANEVEKVYQQGIGSKSRIYVHVPEAVNSSQVNANTIMYILDNGEQRYHNTYPEVKGSLPVGGSKWLNVLAKDDYVVLYTDIFSVTPGSIYKTLYQTNVSIVGMTVSNMIDEWINFSISYQGASEIDVQFSDNNFNVPNFETYNFNTIINVPDTTPYGRYHGEISVHGISLTTGKDVTQVIPITVDVIYVSFNATDPLEAIIGILPKNWSVSLYATQIATKEFYAYSGFTFNKTVNLSFSGDNTEWFSFTPWPNRTSELSLNLSPRDYHQFFVYVKPDSNATEANYTTYVDYTYLKEVMGTNITMNGQSEIYLSLTGDNVSPIVENTTVDKYVFEVGESACVSADIIDNEGISAAAVRFNSSVGAYQELSMTAGECVPGKYSVLIPLLNVSKYTINRVYAYDYASNYGYEEPNLTIDVIFMSYGGSFNGTVIENPDDACWMDGNETWNSSLVSFVDEFFYVDAHDDGWEFISCPNEEFDYVEFNFDSLGVIDRIITSVYVSIMHKVDKDSGILPSGVEEYASRMMLQCYDGSSWTDIEPYPIIDNYDWQNYTNIDISTCIKDYTLANNMSLRLTFDPENDNSDAYHYIDFMQGIVRTDDFYLLDLWPGLTSFPTRADFSNVLNSTNNTFYVDLASINVTDELLDNPAFTGPSLSGWTEQGNISIASGGNNIILFIGCEDDAVEEGKWIEDPSSPTSGTSNDELACEDGNEGDYQALVSARSGSLFLSGSGDFNPYLAWYNRSIDLTGYQDIEISFWHNMESTEDSDDFYIYYWDDSVGSWVEGFHDGSTQVGNGNQQGWEYNSFNVPDDAATSNFSIQFRWETSQTGEHMMLDDVTVTSSDIFGLVEYWFVNGSAGDYGSLNQNFTLTTDQPEQVTLSFEHSGHGNYFTGTAYAYCNLTTQLGIFNVWEETWNSDIHNGVPIEEIVDLTSLVTDYEFTYNIECGAFVENNTIIAFDDISIEVVYEGGSPTNDGWDWKDDTYGTEGSYGINFVTHADPSAASDNMLNDYISVTIGGPNSGTDEVMASGAWGIELYVTNEAYSTIFSNNGKAIVSFNYMVEDLYTATDGVGSGAAWVKARFGKEDERNYLGTDLDNDIDSTLHYTDATNEIWTAVDIQYPDWGSPALGDGIIYRSFSEDITQYITGSGRYYFDLGGKISWLNGNKADDEGVTFYFDNIRIIIVY